MLKIGLMVGFLGALVGGSAIAIFVAGLMAFINNAVRQQNRRFFGLTILLSVWMLFNFADSNAVEPALGRVFLTGDLILALFLAWVFVGFINVFETETDTRMPGRAHDPIPLLLLTAFLNLTLALSILAGLVARVVSNGEAQQVTYSRLFILYVGIILFYFIYGFAKLIQKWRRASRNTKAGISLIFIGLATAATANVLTNVLFPLAISDRATVEKLNLIGYAGLVAMALCIYVSITMQRLFDIRLAAIRALSYFLALVSVAALLILITLGVASVFIQGGLSYQVERWVYASMAVLLAAAFPFLKRKFDKLTDRLFYQDAYDPQIFLAQLNRTLVATIELEKLLRTCAQVIADNLKADYCLFGVRETGFKGVRIVGTIQKDFTAVDVMDARHITPHMPNVVVADYLPAEAFKLKRILSKNDIAVLVRLVPKLTGMDSASEGLGYIMLGQKRSGNMYTSQDVRMLEIIANELVIAIQNALHFEEIQRFNVTLQEEIENATRKLRRANQRLIEMDETKDDFISMASHQLRTPLTSVKGYLSMVLDEDVGKLNAAQAKMLRQAFTSSQRMVFLITDLLNISRLKTGKFVIEPSPTDLSAVIQEEMSQLVETAKAKRIALTYEKPAAFPKLLLDTTKIRQVIMNFMDNAIYYTHDGGHIRVELQDKPAAVELRVVDDGIGVPKSEQPHLFTKFYRAANARKARPDGTGLGLFMAKKVVIAQGGSIIFSSREGHGSTFGFVLSKTRLQAPDQAPAAKPDAAVRPSAGASPARAPAPAKSSHA